MNKLKVTLTGLFALSLSIGVVNAQSAATGSTGSKPATTQKSSTQAKAKPATAKTSTTAAKPATTQHLKKDGTPDMRYKENKAAAAKPATAKTSTAKTATKAAPKKAAATTGTTSTGK